MSLTLALARARWSPSLSINRFTSNHDTAHRIVFDSFPSFQRLYSSLSSSSFASSPSASLSSYSFSLASPSASSSSCVCCSRSSLSSFSSASSRSSSSVRHLVSSSSSSSGRSRRPNVAESSTFLQQQEQARAQFAELNKKEDQSELLNANRKRKGAEMEEELAEEVTGSTTEVGPENELEPNDPIDQFYADRDTLSVFVDVENGGASAMLKADSQLERICEASGLEADYRYASPLQGNLIRHFGGTRKRQATQRKNRKGLRNRWLMYQLRSLLWLRNRGGRSIQ